MNHNFQSALEFVLAWEGGYVNDPDDRGGETNKGVVQTTYDAYRTSLKQAKRSVKSITTDEVDAIYYQRYWLASGCDRLPSRLALVVFDWDVNSGRGVKTLQAAVGAKTDGIFGAKTLNDVNYYLKVRGEAALVTKYNNLRENLYRSWGVGTQAKFLKGWLNRLNALRKVVA